MVSELEKLENHYAGCMTICFYPLQRREGGEGVGFDSDRGKGRALAVTAELNRSVGRGHCRPGSSIARALPVASVVDIEPIHRMFQQLHSLRPSLNGNSLAFCFDSSMCAAASGSKYGTRAAVDDETTERGRQLPRCWYVVQILSGVSPEDVLHVDTSDQPPYYSPSSIHGLGHEVRYFVRERLN